MKSKHYKMISLEEVLKDWEMQLVWNMSFEEGELVKARKISRIMLHDNEPLEKIVKYTQLSVEQIEMLRNEAL